MPAVRGGSEPREEARFRNAKECGKLFTCVSDFKSLSLLVSDKFINQVLVMSLRILSFGRLKSCFTHFENLKMLEISVMLVHLNIRWPTRSINVNRVAGMNFFHGVV